VRLVDVYKKKRDVYGDAFAVEQRSLANPSAWFLEALRGGAAPNSSGQPVTEKTALSIGAVHACVRVIAEGLSTMPLKVYEVKGRDKTVDKTSKAAKLIDEPNSFSTGVSFRKYMTAVAVLHGNSYAYIFRDNSGNPINLFPLQNCNVMPILSNGQLFYKINTSDSIYAGIPDVISALDMLHFKGLCTSNQFTAISPIEYHAQTLGIDLAAMNSIATSFKTGTKKFMLNSDKGWNTEQQTAVKDSFEKLLNNDSLAMTAPTGVSAQSITLTPSEAGYIEAMGFTAKDIARIFGVPASIIGADDGAIKGSVEQDSLNFLNQTLNPWAVNIEAELKMKLLTEREKQYKFFKFNFNSLLRADATARADFYSKMTMMGAMNANEVRELEDMNPYTDGDTYLVPFNQAPASLIVPITQAKIDAMDQTVAQTNNPNGNN
jgi:HK97 family phage portal protein